MSIELSKLTESLHDKCLSLTPEQKEKLTIIVNLGNTYVEVVQFFVNKNPEKDRKILETVADEFFLDIHVAVTLAAGGHFKSGCVVLRAATELGLYILYFIDHIIELRMWASAGDNERNYDMYFLKTLEKIADVSYLSAASICPINSDTVSEIKSELIQSYRLLSERVHGKFRFLQASSSNDDDIFENFCAAAVGALKNLIKLAVQRGKCYPDITKHIPSLENIK